MSTQLDTPVISITAIGQYSLVVSGLSDDNASGWKYKLGASGTEVTVTPDSDGKINITGLDPTTAYSVLAQAVGDGEEYTDSEWSTAVSATTGTQGQFYQWTSSLKLSHDGLKKQNAMFRAKIIDIDGSVLPTAKVSSCTLTAYKALDYIALEDDPTVITGFNGITVPTSCFSSTLDSQGFNFKFVPDQTTNTLMSTDGFYQFVIKTKLTSGNSITMITDYQVG